MIDQPINGFAGLSQSERLKSIRGGEESVAEGIALFGQDNLASIEPWDRRWAWVEVDQSAIRHNLLESRRRLRGGTRMMAVVKADAYGHGAIACARTCLSAGADHLGVATVEEGIQLRKAGIAAPILVLSEPPVEAAPLLLAYHIMPSVYTVRFALAYAELADQHGMRAPFHLAINTGMNRIGLRPDDVIEFSRQVSFHRALRQEGTFTHFATADGAEDLDFKRQLKRFVDTVQNLNAAGVETGMIHAANSAATLRYPEAHFDMVRPGISLYGFHPCPETRKIADLQPAMSVYARVTAVNNVPMSEGVSYGLNYRSPGSVKICTVPIGYADGLNRALSGATNFIMGGQYCKQVGNICMDQCMFEVDLRSYASRERLDPHIGDEVVIVGRQGDAVSSITEMAYNLGTIEHEVAIGFSHRLPRIQV